VLLVLIGVAIERIDTTVPTLDVVEVPVDGLSHEVTLVQATDMHGMEFGAHESRLRDLLRGQHVDAAIITGDVLDSFQSPRQPAYDLAAVLASATPRVYFLPGNHDPPDLGRDLASHGVRPLAVGKPQPLDPTDLGARTVAVAYARDSAAVSAARGFGSQLLVFASHTPPDASRLAAAYNYSVEHIFICGHTHGGQIRLPLLGAIAAPTTWEGEGGGHPGTNDIQLFPDVQGFMVDGMYDRDGQRVYVAGGLGCTWIHARFLCRSSLVLYRFVPAGPSGR
jgi:predicted MPP superfamily phosphohydrolase